MTSSVSLAQMESTGQWFDEALELEAAGRLDDAFALVERILAVDPGFAEAHNLAGDILVKRCDFDAALVRFRRACDLKPDVELYLFDLGCALAFTGDFSAARDVFRRCLELEPSHEEAFPHFGLCLLELGDAAQASAWLRRALQADPSNLAARYHLGRALLALGRRAEGAAELERVIPQFQSWLVVNPRSAEGFYFLGVAFAQLGRLEDAESNLRRAIELDTPEIDYHSSFGLTYHDYDAHLHYARVLRELGRREDALAQAKRALEIRPGDAAARELTESLGEAKAH